MTKRKNYPPSIAKWTKKELEFVIDKKKSGWVYSKISNIMEKHFGVHRTKNSCIGAVKRAGYDEEFFRRECESNGVTYKKPIVTKTKLRSTKQKNLLQVPIESNIIEPEAIGPFNDFYNGCKWIHGDPSVSQWRCCGRQVLDKKQYCDYHFKIAYIPLSNENKRRQIKRGHSKFAYGKGGRWA